ncbi:hypothetical protein WJX72_009395 [[Myrmecia] bisecta]|uniref:Uncharacterized protein n=1 Tax=[Myrmecia] bisecta TaxID=41462 RepID=A0AAW1PE97_9CHLO
MPQQRPGETKRLVKPVSGPHATWNEALDLAQSMNWPYKVASFALPQNGRVWTVPACASRLIIGRPENVHWGSPFDGLVIEEH